MSMKQAVFFCTPQVREVAELLQLHCVSKLTQSKSVVEESLSKCYVGVQRENFVGFFPSILCNSKLGD